MSYIVPNELPKSCDVCPYCYLIMQNPLSSKTPIKRYRCQVGKAPWKTFDVDFYDTEYKDKDCPLVPMERIVKRLENENMTAVDLANLSCSEYQDGVVTGIEKAIEIVKEEGGLND